MTLKAPNPMSMRGTNWVVIRQLVRLLRDEARTASGVVADVGCGSSPYRFLFTKAQRYLRFDQTSNDPEVVLTDALRLPLAASSVDIILLFQVMGDFPDVPEALKEMARVLAPGGRILVYESVAFPEHDLPHDYWRVMPQGLAWAAARAGLRSATTVPLGGLFARLAIEVNTQVLARLDRYPLLRPLAAAMTMATNLLCAGLDRAFLIRSASPDYFACLTAATDVAPGGPRP